MPVVGWRLRLLRGRFWWPRAGVSRTWLARIRVAGPAPGVPEDQTAGVPLPAKTVGIMARQGPTAAPASQRDRGIQEVSDIDGLRGCPQQGSSGE